MTLHDAELIVLDFTPGRVLDATDVEAVRLIASNRYHLDRKLRTLAGAARDPAPEGGKAAGRKSTGSGA